MHLVTGTGNSPSLGQPTHGVVKQDKSSGGSVDITTTRSGPQRVRMSSGERPIGAAKGKQCDTEALCRTFPPNPYISETAFSHRFQKVDTPPPHAFVCFLIRSPPPPNMVTFLHIAANVC